jgi:hypothetical protein
MKRTDALALLALGLPVWAHAACGELLSVPAASGSTRYVLAAPTVEATSRVALVLLVGGSGSLELNEAGCPRKLQGNTLVRSLPHFQSEGLFTALVDAPTGYSGEDGLAGYRSAPEHAQDLGRVIADVRARTGATVWVVGTSRGTISAANAAARLDGEAAPDGVVLSSILSVGGESARKPWVTQSVFNLPLDRIRMPALLLAQHADGCGRSPPAQMSAVAARLTSSRLQAVTVQGGPGKPDPGVDACEGRSPHGFVGQEAEVAAGIARFVRGQPY